MTQLRRISWKSSFLLLALMVMPDQLFAQAKPHDKALELFQSERFEEALPEFEKALTEAESRYGADSPRIAAEVNNLAEVYRVLGRYDEAENLYMRAIALDEQNGSDNPDIATTMNNLALLYRAQGRLPEAELYWERALNILENSLGPRHPNVAKSQNNLAVLYESQGRIDEAVSFSDRAAEVAVATLGQEHPTTISILRNQATIHEKKKVFDRERRPAGPASTQVTELNDSTSNVIRRGEQKPGPQDQQIQQNQETQSRQQNQAALFNQLNQQNQSRPRQQERANLSEPPPVGSAQSLPRPRYVVHLASVRTEASANAEWNRLAGIYGELQNMRQQPPSRVSTSNGDFYRVWGGAFANLDEAAAMCATLKARGAYCAPMSFE